MSAGRALPWATRSVTPTSSHGGAGSPTSCRCVPCSTDGLSVFASAPAASRRERSRRSFKHNGRGLHPPPGWLRGGRPPPPTWKQKCLLLLLLGRLLLCHGEVHPPSCRSLFRESPELSTPSPHDADARPARARVVHSGED